MKDIEVREAVSFGKVVLVGSFVGVQAMNHSIGIQSLHGFSKPHRLMFILKDLCVAVILRCIPIALVVPLSVQLQIITICITPT